MKFATQAIRIAQCPDSDHRAVINPIYQSATFAWKSLDDVPRIDYTRVTNPNRDTLEQVLAALEGAEYCVCSSSGMAAVMKWVSHSTASPSSIDSSFRTAWPQ